MSIPEEIKSIVEKLENDGFESYVVGGCVRDFLRGEKPKDWDIATNARPEEISHIFRKHYINNQFGTVTVLTDSKEEELKEIEITPYRTEEKYSDKRHPDKVHWAESIEEDLARRDFTINAIAAEISKGRIKKTIDPYNGKKDLGKKIIKAVGKPKERFSEDALRMMRAVRFATIMGFEIEKKTAEAIKDNSDFIREISNERIRDELIKIIMARRAAEGIELLRTLDLLKHIIPELLEGYKISQNKHHIYDVYDHAVRSLEYAAKKEYNKHVRIAALLHDVGKPRSKEGEGEDATFYNHEIIGAKMTYQILSRLKFSKKDINKITKLVRYHLFYYHPDEVGESSIRKLVRQVGLENMDELIQIRKCDRIGSGCPKAEPYKLRYLRYVIEKVSQDPISAKMLKLTGKDVMNILDIKPGPRVGQVLDILLSLVLDNPEKNKKEVLEKEVKKIAKLSEKEIAEIAKQSKKKREEIEIKREEMTKKKYWVS
jgi:tRNA nucleotidyltransferase (CCA-adding enzyme)